MGTSRNDRSPLTSRWRMTMAVIGRKEIPPPQQTTEIWRAAIAEREQQMVRDFSHPALAEACRMVADKVPVHEAVARFTRSTAYDRDSGLALEMGKRALARCAATGSNAQGFVGELFAEAVSYYASRDLPSFVGAQGRVATTSQAISLKNQLRIATKQRVVAAGSPKTDKAEWRKYVREVMKRLKSGSSQ